MKKIILTGDRPTGKLHLGHYVGSLKNRVLLQEDYEQFILIADTQALTDHIKESKKINHSILEVMKDYISVGINPNQSTIFLQSNVKGLFELTCYLMNIVSVSRLERIPTIKNEIEQKFTQSPPIGFLNYPISQAADILAFDADIIPVGDDQLPLLELVNEIAHKFNLMVQNKIFKPCQAYSSTHSRLMGTDGKKMSKSLGNTINLDSNEKEIKDKVMKMYTDKNHINISDPGKIEGNQVFYYLDVFHQDRNELDALKTHYQKGGLGDVYLKKLLIKDLNELIAPIREKRSQIMEDELFSILEIGNKKANQIVEQKLELIRDSLNFF
jgi:tryptophanyl-tRNA synthetase